MIALKEIIKPQELESKRPATRSLLVKAFGTEYPSLLQKLIILTGPMNNVSHTPRMIR
jgi:hypothetical protein